MQLQRRLYKPFQADAKGNSKQIQLKQFAAQLNISRSTFLTEAFSKDQQLKTLANTEHTFTHITKLLFFIKLNTLIHQLVQFSEMLVF